MKCITLASAMLLFWAVNGVQSLKCYTCSSNAAAPNFKCENDALNVPLVDCSPQMVYCLTMVTESATLGLIFSPRSGRALMNSSTPTACTNSKTSPSATGLVREMDAMSLHPSVQVSCPSYQNAVIKGNYVRLSGVLLVIASALWTV